MHLLSLDASGQLSDGSASLVGIALPEAHSWPRHRAVKWLGITKGGVPPAFRRVTGVCNLSAKCSDRWPGRLGTSARTTSLADVQGCLFDTVVAPSVDPGHDPYDELREATARLTDEYAIDKQTALDAILAFGSESGARRILRQRWWNGQVEMRELEAA